jgi:hypothetical protein
MAISRYWRIVGFATRGNGVLELSEARIYEAGVLADAAATLSATIEPSSGALTDLRDGVATGVVSWPYVSYSKPGFALVWDFGVGGGVEFPGLRLGSGASAETFPQDLIGQSSADGVNWSLYATIASITYPGANALAGVPVTGVSSDPNFSSVSLLLHFDGNDNSSAFVDSSPLSSSNVISGAGGAVIKTANSKFGGSSLALLKVSAQYLALENGAAFNFGTSDFTIELWFYLTSLTTEAGLFMASNMVSGGGVAGGVRVDAYGRVIWTAFGSQTMHPGLYTVSVGAWHHIAIVRTGTTANCYYDGATVGSTMSFAAGTQPWPYNATYPIQIGTYDRSGNNFVNGYIDEVRVTKGVARYTAPFTPPGLAFAGMTGVFLPSTPLSRFSKLSPSPERLLPGIALPDTTANSHLREYPFFDAYNGGLGIINGTVKGKGTPDVPLHRKVWLMDQASGMVVRETWSSASTGAYEFKGVRQDALYSVISYDYTQTFRAVIADRVLPELMP